MRDERLGRGRGREDKDDKRRKEKYTARGGRPSAITTVSAQNCLDRRGMIGGDHNLSH